MKIKVLSRLEFEKFESKEPYIAISITDPNSEPVIVNGNDDNFQSMLSLQFYDLDKDTEVFPYSRFIFNERDAKQILDFVDVYKDNIDMICIHCEAGISRSAGIASALSLIYNGEDQYYFDHYIPNMLVYRTILDVWQGGC